MHTYITVLLDHSGSMCRVENATRDGFNKFLRDQKSLPGEATITLVTFADEAKVVYENLPISEAPELTWDSYRPGGNTKLIDTIGMRIHAANRYLATSYTQEDRPNKIIFVIITDGQDTHSKVFSAEEIKLMVDEQEERHAWEFVFLGANQDAIKNSARFGVKANKAQSYDASAQGTGFAFEAVSRGVSGYRQKEGKVEGEFFSEQDKKRQDDLLQGH